MIAIVHGSRDGDELGFADILPGACTVSAGTGAVGTANVTSVAVTCNNAVEPFYPVNGVSWNQWVGNDGTGLFDASDTACSASVPGNCLHGGGMRALVVSGYSVWGAVPESRGDRFRPGSAPHKRRPGNEGPRL